jgi:hypothetical protein
MRIFDSILLLVVSGFLCVKFPFLGILVLVLGLFIQFQNARARMLLGSEIRNVPGSRKFKSLALSLMVGVPLLPLLIDVRPDAAEKGFSYDSLLPLISVIALFSASMMVALTVEKRKR